MESRSPLSVEAITVKYVRDKLGSYYQLAGYGRLVFSYANSYYSLPTPIYGLTQFLTRLTSTNNDETRQLTTSELIDYFHLISTAVLEPKHATETVFNGMKIEFGTSRIAALLQLKTQSLLTPDHVRQIFAHKNPTNLASALILLSTNSIFDTPENRDFLKNNNPDLVIKLIHERMPIIDILKRNNHTTTSIVDFSLNIDDAKKLEERLDGIEKIDDSLYKISKSELIHATLQATLTNNNANKHNPSESTLSLFNHSSIDELLSEKESEIDEYLPEKKSKEEILIKKNEDFRPINELTYEKKTTVDEEESHKKENLLKKTGIFDNKKHMLMLFKNAEFIHKHIHKNRIGKNQQPQDDLELKPADENNSPNVFELD